MIWRRYLFSSILKVFFLFLGCFFFLYSLLDYSLHMQDFLVDKKIQFTHIFIYYFYQFIKRADLLVPLALMIATLKVLLTLNARGELVALQASGISAKRLLRPFFLVALVCTLFNWASAEFLLPSSLNFLDRFRQDHFKHVDDRRKEPIHVLFLKDHSRIIYQKKEKGLLYDVFWIRSSQEIWRMKYLNPDSETPVGYFADRIISNSEGVFEKSESFEQIAFSPFRLQKDPIGKGLIPTENQRLSQLFGQLTYKRSATAFERPQVLSHFLHKCLMPLLSFLVILGVAPYCLRYSRAQPVFFLYAVALFLFIAFAAFLDASLILGETQVLSAYVATLLPFVLVFTGFGWLYQRKVRA
jgi:lipopolysaccharide export system permease protein